MKKINHIDSIRNPIITEKATILSEQNKTVFKVHEKANKKTIKKNIEKLFKVNVIKVNIINQKSKLKMKQGKKSIKSGYKKAIITLKKGQSIDLNNRNLIMALKTFKPYTKSTRGTVVVDKSTLWKGSSYKPLTRGQHVTGGRNNAGRITSRHMGGGQNINLEL